jgi:hypothetical protein
VKLGTYVYGLAAIATGIIDIVWGGLQVGFDPTTSGAKASIRKFQSLKPAFIELPAIFETISLPCNCGKRPSAFIIGAGYEQLCSILAEPIQRSPG